MPDPRSFPLTEHIAQTARDWLIKLSSGTLNEADLDAFKAWRAADPEHERAFVAERRLWQEMQHFERDFTGAPAPRTTRNWLRPVPLSAAAGLAACLVLAMVLWPEIEVRAFAEIGPA